MQNTMTTRESVGTYLMKSVIMFVRSRMTGKHRGFVIG